MSTIETHPSVAAAGGERLALVGGAALLVAGLILVGAVLPAEYGVDPLGTGRVLGLTAMSDVQKGLEAFQATRATATGGAPTIVPQERHFQQDTATFTLAPGESIEYKYRLDKGQVLLFSWTATSAVDYEFHAEPDDAPRGYAETYEKKAATSAASGTLTAPFSGIHGWYWLNPGSAPATVNVSAAGFFTMSHEFHGAEPPRTKMFP